MNSFTSVLRIILVSTLLVQQSFGAPNGFFNTNDNVGLDEASSKLILPQQDEDAKLVLPALEGEDGPEAVSFPLENDETVGNLGEDGSPKAPIGIIPAHQTDGRTFYHLERLHRKIDDKVNYLWTKLISSFLPPPQYFGDPHHFNGYPYIYDYDNNFRRDGNLQAKLSSIVPKALKSLAALPQYLTSHPINFKKTIDKINQHNVGKRSIGDNGHFISEGVSSETKGANSDDASTMKQGRTLRFDAGRRTNTISFTSLINLLPKIIQTMRQGHIRFPTMEYMKKP